MASAWAKGHQTSIQPLPVSQNSPMGPLGRRCLNARRDPMCTHPPGRLATFPQRSRKSNSEKSMSGNSSQERLKSNHEVSVALLTEDNISLFIAA